jgi:outer membrane protein TolC
MKKLLIFLLFTSSIIAETLTLEDCYKLAYSSSPLVMSNKYYSKMKSIKSESASSAYYPDFNISAQAKYQSDVLQLPIKLPTLTIPEIPKDNYQILLNVNQLIYDGSAVNSQKNLFEKQFDVDNSNVEIELYKLRERINGVFFGALQLQERIKILNNTKDDLDEKIRDLTSKIDNGVALQSNKDYLLSEKIKIESNIFELQNNIKSFVLMLSKLINQNLSNDVKLSYNDENKIPELNFSDRKEFKAFNSTKELLKANKDVVDSKYLPKVSAFLQAGYGKPGLNMFDPDFQPFYIAGLRASWSPWSWGNQDREKELLDVQSEMVKIQEDNFKLNIEILSLQDKNEIEKTINYLKSDDQIIELKKTVLKVSESKFNNGIITGMEYFNDLTSLKQAELNKALHKIDLVKYINSYKTTLGEK